MARVAPGLDRDEAVRRVALAIAVGPATVDLPYEGPDGSRPLVVTTPNEYLSAVIERVEAVGGSANIALAFAKNFTVFTITRKTDDTKVEDELNRDISMGMFHLRAQAKRRQGSFRLRNAAANISQSVGEFAYA